MASISLDDLRNLVEQWLKIPAYQNERRFLEVHLELLDRRSEDILKVLISQYTEQPEMVQNLRDRLALLCDITKRGNSIAAVREGYVNAFGGLALELPLWLKKVEHRLDKLCRIGRLDQTAAERVRLLRAALVHAQNETGLAPEVLAELNSQLWNALGETTGVNQQRRQEEGIACLQTALRVYTRTCYPRQYARTQTNLGNAYGGRIAGKRRCNLEQAISHYRKALRIYTLKAFPLDYARTQNNLGLAYRDRIAGKRRCNLEQAIMYFKEALHIFTPDAFPAEYAAVQTNLGLAYGDRIAGEQRANLEEAIKCFKKALRIRTVESFPVEYARTQNGLGTAYTERIAGEQRANLEEAITCFKKALCIFTVDAFSVDYARTQANLGIAYWHRIAGERRTNLEEAIRCFKKALCIFTEDAFPVDYAMMQDNLGLAYYDRVEGERDTNLEKAIAYHQEALRIRTVKAFPVEYARTQINLGNAYAEHMAGKRHANLEQAISCYRKALRVYTLKAFPVDYATTQTNLGTAYQDRMAGKGRSNLEQAISCYRKALRVYTLEAFPVDYARTQYNLGTAYTERIAGKQQTNLEQAIACFKKALCTYSLEAFPREYRNTQLNRAFIEAIQDNWESAHDAYRCALDAEDLLVTLGAGIIGRDVVLREGHDAAVHDGFALIRLKRLSKATVTIERGRARGLAEAMAFDAADPALIRNKELSTRYAHARDRFKEAQKDLNLNARLSHDESKQRELNLKYTEAYHQTKADLDAIVTEVRAAKDPADFLETKLDPTKILQITEQVGPSHALVYLAATPWGGIAVGVSGASPSASEKDGFVFLDLPHFTTDFVDHLVESHLGDDTQRVIGGFAHAQVGSAWSLIQQSWSGATFQQQAETLHRACKQTGQTSTLDAAAQELLTIFTVAHLVNQPLAALSETSLRTLENTLNQLFLSQELSHCLKALADAGLRQLVSWLQEQGITSLTLIPCGSLAAFPLVSAPLADGHTVGETLPTSIAPSARSLLHDDKQTRGKRTGVYAIGDPWSTTYQQLLWGEAEAHTLVELGYRLRGLPAQARVYEAAARKWLIEVLQRGSIVDASCHGYFNVSEPLQSALFLAADEQLTLGDMLSYTADLRGLRLLILSACQTAILDLRGARDEVRSLSAAMLQAGARAVLAPLWSVDEKATYLLVVRFGQEWLPHMESEPPAAALARAQSWLRTATNSQLQKWHNLPAPTVQGQRGRESQVSTYEGGKIELSVGKTHFTTTRARIQVRADAKQLRADASCPYADPIYWAGFQLTGW